MVLNFSDDLNHVLGRGSVCVKSTRYMHPSSLESMCECHTRVKKTTSRKGRNVVGGNIRRIRMSQKIPVSQQDLSGRLASRGIVMDRSAVARIESGTRYVLDYEAVAIAAAFRVPISELFEE
jgi:hypothetical protein